MKIRLSFVLLAAFLTVLLAVGLLPSPTATATAYPTGTMSGTPTPLPSWTPSPTPLAQSPTAVPLPATHTSLPGETPQTLATSTLLPIPTETLIFFPTSTATVGGTATPPVPVAYAEEETLEACYKGPSRAYIQTDSFEIAAITGKDESGEWWYVLFPKGQGVFVNCWVAGDEVTTGGNLESLLVTQAELPQITEAKIESANQTAEDREIVKTVACGHDSPDAVLHFIGRIFANGPVERVGYIWDTNAPVDFKPEQTAIEAWDTPARINLALSVPAQSATYSLSLRTTFPMEAVGELRFTVQCK